MNDFGTEFIVAEDARRIGGTYPLRVNGNDWGPGYYFTVDELVDLLKHL